MEGWQRGNTWFPFPILGYVLTNSGKRTIANGRCLRVTADDFGLTPGVTNGILQAFDKGIVTHTSVLANGLDFDRAMKLARKTTGLGIGVHLNLTLGHPVLHTSKVSSLVKPDGRFCQIWLLVFRSLSGCLDRGQLLTEWGAQIKRVLEAGIQPTHIDSHHHIHLLPFCFSVVSELVRKYKIPYVRRPVECWNRFTGVRALPKRLGFNLLCRRFWPAQASDAFFGVALQEHPCYSDILSRFICNLPQGLTELMVHPGFEDEVLKRVDRPFHRGREVELKALCNPILPGILKKSSICLERPTLFQLSRTG